MDARSVRMDVYVKDEKEFVYDIEMQVGNTAGKNWSFEKTEIYCGLFV